MIWVFYLSNQIAKVRYCSFEWYHLVFIDPINLGGRKMFKHLFIDPIRWRGRKEGKPYNAPTRSRKPTLIPASLLSAVSPLVHYVILTRAGKTTTATYLRQNAHHGLRRHISQYLPPPGSLIQCVKYDENFHRRPSMP